MHVVRGSPSACIFGRQIYFVFFLVKKKQLVFIYFMGVLKRIQGKNRDHLVDVVRFFLTIIGVIRYVLKTTFKSNKDRVMTGITKDKYIMKL